VVKYFGYKAGFLGLAGIAFAGMLFLALVMPETRGYEATTTGNRVGRLREKVIPG
jgi:hypothetical protein